MSRAARTLEVMAPNGDGAGEAKPKPKPRAPQRKPVVEENRISSGDKHLEWVPVGAMRISPRSQRRHDSKSSKEKIEDIFSNFDLDKFGTLTVNLRDGVYWVIDGGHRYLAVIKWFGEGWETQELQCWTYHGLTEAEEADKFLALNDVKQVSIMDKFQQALVAGHETETDIDRVVRLAGLSIGTGHESIGCVGAVSKTYAIGGPKVLATTLRVIRESYGNPGFSSKVTEGVGKFVANHENVFSEDFLVQKLTAKKGGVAGLVEEARLIQLRYGVSLATSVAAAVVETYNKGRGTNGPRPPKLEGWWATLASQ